VLGPREADRLTRALPLRPGEKISLPIFLEEFPQTLVTMQAEVGLKEKRAVQGVERDLWKIDSRLSVLPGIKISVWVNEQADTILSVLPFPGLGELEMVTCTKEEALQAKGAPELFVGTMIRPDRPLKNYRQLTEVRLRLSGAQRIELAAGPEQEIVSCTDAATEIRIRVPQIEAKAVTWKLPAKVTPELKAYLQPSPLIDANEPLVAQLARQAVGSETNPLLAARKIEAFVRSYITDKTMKVNFASAGQTAHARAGDCTEHGVLCAALGRAVGLPTRVVVGLGYLPTNYDGTEPSANGEFGFHLWAEAWLGEGRWVAMDAALGQFDVGHIAIFKTALESANPTVELAQPVLALMEKLKIEVLEMK
jgi:hypothetical protein